MNLADVESRFKTLSKIKKGGQKTVYKAELPSGDVVAYKVIDNANDPRILQEIEVVKQLNLNNIPKIFETGIAYDVVIGENVLYIIEEYVAGTSLRDWLRMGNTFNLRQAFSTLHKLLEIEIELEKKQIIHRDINPNNIILADSGEIYLIDFGLAKCIGGQSLTMTLAQHGPYTPGYAPSEQFHNDKKNQDVRTDLFQIGVTIYEACAGKNPFVNPNETVEMVMSRTLAFIPEKLVISGESKGVFAQLISMLMAKHQTQRPDTASDAMRYLKGIEPTLFMED